MGLKSRLSLQGKKKEGSKVIKWWPYNTEAMAGAHGAEVQALTAGEKERGKQGYKVVAL